jgi:hypothetical protein
MWCLPCMALCVFPSTSSDPTHRTVCIPPACPACGRHCRVRQCASIHLSMLCPTPCRRCRLPCCCSQPFHVEVDTTKNGQKLSVNTKTISFHIFLENKIENINFRNENDIDNSETSETKACYENYIGYDRNLKYIKIVIYPQLTS